MLKIGICDDEKLVVEELRKIILNIISDYNWEAEIQIFYSGLELIKMVSGLDIVFLDIEMPGLDGIDTGQRIKELNRHCKILMETSRVERFKESFRIRAFRFITKPFDTAEIKEALSAAWHTRLGIDKIGLYENRNLYDIEQREIKYISAYDSYTEFFVGSRVFRKEIALNELEQSLDKNLFFRIHRKYIVNMLWIDSLKHNVVKIGGKEIAVSRRRKKEFEQKYIEFDLQYR